MKDINLEHIAMSGQCFRLNRINDNLYSLIHDGKYYELPVDKNGILLANPLSDYFDSNTDYTSIIDASDKQDIYLQKSIEHFGDIVILKQNLWEVIISFIISQRKSISAIKICIEKICRMFGNPIMVNNRTYYSFPDANTLSCVSIEDLQECGVGYRAKYILNAAEWFLNNKDNVTKESILDIYGVGNKVANCISLFGLHDLSSCPVDVWIQRIIDDRYHGIKPKWMDSEYAGVYQQYVFMYERFLNNK